MSAFLSAIKADPKLATDAKSVPLILAIAGASLADSEKLPVAKQLDEFGYPDVAAAILASKDDIDDWIAYRRSHPLPGADTQSLFESFVSDTGPMLRHRGLSGLTQKLSIPPAGDISSAFDLAVLQSHRLAPLGGWVIQLFARGAPITLNAALFRQIDEGSLDPSNLDDLTIAITKELDKAFGNAKRQQITARQVVPLQIVSREGNGFPAEMWIDIALARRALSPLLLDHAAEPPSKPQAFGANPSWETWVAVAKALQQGKQPPEGFFTPYIEAELLAAAGRSNEAIAILSALARKGDNYGATTAFATKFLVSLLRRCDDEMRSASLTSIHVFRLGEP